MVCQRIYERSIFLVGLHVEFVMNINDWICYIAEEKMVITTI